MIDAPDLADPASHLASIWNALDAATRSPDAPFRTPTLLTISLDGSPAGRTVVLRSIDAMSRELRFFADARSPKVEQLSRDGRSALVFWDAKSQVQLRVTGECVRLYDEQAIADAWQRVPESNRLNYRTTLPPGSEVERADAIEHVDGDGFENFALLVFVANELGWLRLDRAGHKRCRFDLSTSARTWIVP